MPGHGKTARRIDGRADEHAAQVGGLLSSVAYGYIVSRFHSYDAPFVPMAALLFVGTRAALGAVGIMSSSPPGGRSEPDAETNGKLTQAQRRTSIWLTDVRHVSSTWHDPILNEVKAIHAEEGRSTARRSLRTVRALARGSCGDGGASTRT